MAETDIRTLFVTGLRNTYASAETGRRDRKAVSLRRIKSGKRSKGLLTRALEIRIESK
jgi:hypothetical protein